MRHSQDREPATPAPAADASACTTAGDAPRAGTPARASEQAAGALAASEVFRVSFEHAAIGMAIVGVDGRWLRVNPVLCELLGYAAEELLDRRFQDITHPDDVARDLAQARRLLAGERTSDQIEKRYIRKDGRIVWMQRTASLVRDAAGEPLYYVSQLQDISERKAAEAEIRRYRALVEHLPLVTYEVPFDAAGRTQYISPQVEALLGYRPEDFRVRPELFFERLHPDDVEAVQAALARSRSEGRPVAVEYRILDRDGGVHLIRDEAVVLRDADGRPLSLQGFMLDITDRGRAQAALAASEERFRALIESSSEVVTIIAADATVLYNSPALERVLGYTPDELLGHDALERIHPDDQPPVRQVLGELLATPGAAGTVEYRYRHNDGSWRTLQSRAVNRLHHPSVGGIVVNSRDVTESRALEGQLRQAQKMEAVGRLAGGVAHDFNNLLTGIKGYVAFLLADLPESDARRADVREIEKAADRAAGLTRQLLAFSRKQVLQPRILDLNAAVLDLRTMLQRLIGEDIQVDTRLEPGLGSIEADPGQIEQVLLNLAVNARDAMPAGGHLVIATSEVELDEAEARRIGTPRPGPYVVLSVTDTGSGIPADAIPFVFEPFFTTKEPGKGTGLGLSTVYGIVTQSGGSVTVDSRPGHGAAFRVYLPRVAEPAAEGPPPAAAGRAHVGAGTILLVEDDAAVRRLARRILDGAGYRVLEAAGGAEAIRLTLDAAAPRIDLLLTDLVMPQMSGVELARRLTRRQPDLKVLFMSGYAADTIERQGALGPDTPFLEKPFTPPGLTRAVREVLEARWRADSPLEFPS
ncbi:MAG TPA: PAS domain S-box protein [Longimicrobiales bacterium]|nr:PAS domain S-box protein [Longimicrobiales bacterium]